MPLSWNEIKSRATAFSNEWKDEISEHAEAKSFWDGFFNIFGISRRRVATFEHHVKKLNTKDGYIDLFWPGMLIAEHKSRGKNLDKAFTQALNYSSVLSEKELPRYIITSDFENFRLYDLEENTQHDFSLAQLTAHVHLFGFIAGYQKRTYKDQDPVNIEAAELMGRLHDKLKAIGYTGHQLEVYLVRLLFCLFADDTNIFERGIFQEYIEQKTNADGTDLAAHISQLFTILNTAPEKRLTNIDESLNAFPYVNGKLFEEPLSFASFDSGMRKALLDCCLLDWGKISPAIFGSLFQSVMDEKARRNLGAHYTSEKNILKLIKPLFLDELRKEFETVKSNKARLQKFHDKISRLRFLDPACGCGNFLIIAYRELRLLEIDIIKTLLFTHEKLRAEVAQGAGIDVGHLIKCDVDRFYGIEYEEFPAQIATVALWLIDHQMNMLTSETFGEYYVRLPLRKSATIVHGNALRIDWQSLLQPQLSDLWNKEDTEQLRYNYILGNPPFIGHQWRNEEQISDMNLVFGDAKRSGRLDYVAAWYIKAAQYMQNIIPPKEGSINPLHQASVDYHGIDSGTGVTKAAFVSTNSISQGEQVSILWNELFNNYKIKIHFAHRTFKWTNEAKGNAAVHVVIIGFSNFDITEKLIFEYDDVSKEPHEVRVKNINPYLTEGKDIFIESRGKPIHNYPEMIKGSQPTDGGFLLLDETEYLELIKNEPSAKKWIKPFVGAFEFINGNYRHCLWLKNISPSELRSMPFLIERIEKVRESRLKSPTPSVKEFSKFPHLFTQDRQPSTNYLVIPEVSSINREYIPLGFLSPEIICSNKLQIIANASLWMFGILQSNMHMTWTRYVCGRMKSDFSYSPQVYNNFPWPESPTQKQKDAVEAAAQAVLDARRVFQEPTDGSRGASLADLYDPNTMPPLLVKAHQQLDRAVDLCYRPQAFINETKRIEFLFELYDRYTAGIFVKEKKGGRKIKK